MRILLRDQCLKHSREIVPAGQEEKLIASVIFFLSSYYEIDLALFNVIGGHFNSFQ